jgi:hypothetical protein
MNFYFLITLLLCCSISGFAQEAKPAPPTAQAGASKAEKEKAFKEIVERIKKSDRTVDFKAARMLYTELDAYSPMGGSRGGYTKLIEAGENRKAIELAQATLKENYLDIDAHWAILAAANNLKDAELAAHHLYVVKGILDSIVKSGDGRSEATAFVVISVSEEYAMLRAFKLRPKGQSALKKDGHDFDVITCVDPAKPETEAKMYFNTDAIWRGYNKMIPADKKD